MRTTLTLNGPLSPNLSAADPNGRRVSVAVGQAAAELEARIKTNIQRSVPAGRTYRIGGIVRKFGPKRNVPGLRRRGPNVNVGSKIHRASKRGQPPAIRTGRLINSIRGRRVSDFAGRVGVGVAYARPLDNPNGLHRPFFMSQAREYRPRFLELLRAAWTAG